MKKGLFILLAVALAAFMAAPALADRKGHGRGYEQPARDRHQGQSNARRHQDKYRDRERVREHAKDRERVREHAKDRERVRERATDRGRHYDYRQPGHHPRGYRTQPRGRHYGNPHMVKGHSYHYDGHWNSWRDWEKYRSLHAARFHRGGYYRESGHLYFRFCDPAGGACFFFSIGR
jgi:hypothetical protein